MTAKSDIPRMISLAAYVFAKAQGNDFTIEELESATSISRRELMSVIKPLMTAGLIHRTGSRTPRYYSFSRTPQMTLADIYMALNPEIEALFQPPAEVLSALSVDAARFTRTLSSVEGAFLGALRQINMTDI